VEHGVAFRGQSLYKWPLMSDKRRKPLRAKSPADPNSERRRGSDPALKPIRSWSAWLLLPALLAATLTAYYPAWHGGMIWDDDHHVTRGDLQSAEGLKRIWFDIGATQQYYPAAHSAFWLQHKIWGDDTLGYHLVNIMLHALSAFLIAVILQRLAVPGWWLTAVIFALHPVHVESVAWISELKNTLSGVFYLGAMLAYLQFEKNGQKWRYACALGLFLFALWSKTVTATLPAALLLVFWWQRGRLSWRRDVLPLLPWFVFSAAGSLLTAWVERSMIGAQGAPYQFTLIERGLIAGRAIWFYLAKLFWPAHLIFIYPRWQISQGNWWLYLFPLSAVLMLACLWRVRSWSRAPLAALLFFCGTLFPALGFINVYPFRYSLVADHFQYLASISILALFSAGLVKLSARWQLASTRAIAAAAAVLGCVLALPTWSQSRQYVDAETLYRTTISRNPSCWMAYNNLGNALQKTGNLEEAVIHHREALRLNPEYGEAHNNLGTALQGLGHIEETIAQYGEAVRLAPGLAGAHYNLGNALQELGQFEAAVTQYREGIRLEPGYAEMHCNLGASLDRLGQLEESVVQFKEAVRLKPDYDIALINLGNVLQRMGKPDEALIQYQQALRLKPDSAGAYNALGGALQRQGRLEEAMTRYRQALQLKPDFAEAYNNLGNALLASRRPLEAVTQYQEALRLLPGFAGTHFNLGNALQEAGRSEEAIVHYLEALRLKPDFLGARLNLAHLLQGLGRYPEALEQYQEAAKYQPDSADVHNSLGVALATLGRLEEAAAQFREALRLQSDYADARANLARATSMLKKDNSADTLALVFRTLDLLVPSTSTGLGVSPGD
jgi:protein O-mannosyl-transferase